MYDVFPYIEPCCYQKQLPQVFELAERRGVVSYLSNSDWTLSLLLEWLCWHVPGGVLTVCLIHIKDSTLARLREMMGKTAYSPKRKATVPLISRLELLIRGEEREQVDSMLGDWIREDRVVVVNYPRLAFRCVTISDDEGRAYVVQGSLNQDTVDALQMVTISSGVNPYNEIHRPLASILKLKG